MMHTGLKPIIDGTTQHIGMAYRYDQLNRISSSTAFDNYNNTTNEWGIGGVALIDYSEHFGYDPNGNITTLNRKGGTSLSSPPPPSTNMDDMTYNYYAGTNKLAYVDDNTSYTGNYTDDIDDQNMANYNYDAIGNLISDVAEDITSIEWTVYGKIKSITRGTPSSTNPNLEFTYTPDGHRATKKVMDGSGSNMITVMQLPECGDFEALHCQPSTNFDRSTKLDLTTESPLLGRCCCHNLSPFFFLLLLNHFKIRLLSFLLS